MVEPIITTGTALVAAGAWFSQKLLGPSADSIGKQLEAFTNDRLVKIFHRTEEIGTKSGAKPLPPGFAYLALQKASFSEDDDAITEMWANLLTSSANEFHQTNLLYAEVLSQITSREAKYLDEFGTYYLKYQMTSYDVPLRIKNRIERYASEIGENDFFGISRAILNNIHEIEDDRDESYMFLSAIVLENYDSEDRNIIDIIEIQDVDERTDSLQILERQNIVEKIDINVPINEFQLHAKYYCITKFGINFLKVCRGETQNRGNHDS